MASKAEAYVDTSALIAFFDKSDSFHALFRNLFSEPPKLVTTPLVVAEGHGWFLRRFDSTRALQFMGFIEEFEPLSILSVGARENQAALSLLRRFSNQDLTLADAMGLQMMRERRIKTCWSTDRHMGLTGISLVIHQ